MAKESINTAGAQRYTPDYSGPAFRYTQPDTPPPGVSANQFDQSAINWQMAQKYGAERAQQNRDIQAAAALAYNDWQLNGGRGTAPGAPALFETSPNALYDFFNSNRVGIPVQGGRVLDYAPGGTNAVDPLQLMLRSGGGPLVPPGAPPPAVAPPTGPAPATVPPGAGPTGGIPAGARPANMWNQSVQAPSAPDTYGGNGPRYEPPPVTPAMTGQDPGSIAGYTSPAAAPAATRRDYSAAVPPAPAPPPAAAAAPAAAGRGSDPQTGRAPAAQPYTMPNDSVQAMQAPAAGVRAQNFARGAGLPQPQAYNPIAQGPSPPPQPVNTYNALQVPRYGRQFRPTGAMSGSYASPQTYGGQMRRY